MPPWSDKNTRGHFSYFVFGWDLICALDWSNLKKTLWNAKKNMHSISAGWSVLCVSKSIWSKVWFNAEVSLLIDIRVGYQNYLLLFSTVSFSYVYECTFYKKNRRSKVWCIYIYNCYIFLKEFFLFLIWSDSTFSGNFWVKVYFISIWIDSTNSVSAPLGPW